MKHYIIILSFVIAVGSCNNQKHPIDSLHTQNVSLLENPLDSLLNQFMSETKQSSRYFIFIYQSAAGVILTFRTNNIDFLIDKKIQPILTAKKNGKFLYFYTGIEHLFKFDTIHNYTNDLFKRDSYNISRSYIHYDIDNRIEIVKHGYIPPYAPPPSQIIELQK